MSKKSRRRNQMLAAGLAAIGASKLGMLGGKTASGIAGDKMASARKLMTSDTAMKGSSTRFPKTIMPKGVNVATKVGPGIKVTPEMKEKNLQDFKDSITRLKERRGETGMMKKVTSDSKAPGFFGFKFDKPLFKSGGSVMAKCKLGRNKKTKIY